MRTVFFVQNEWAFGSIHNELAKRLHSRGINCFVLPWNVNYSRREIQEIDAHIGFWVTTPHGARDGLLTYGIHPSRMAVISHSREDTRILADLLVKHGDFALLGSVSKPMQEYGRELGLETRYMPVRISINNYSHQPSEILRKIGYAGATNPYYKENKRFYLVEQACKIADIELVVAESYHHSWVTNTSFYRNVDVVVQASMHEGLGLPQLEGGAAGRLVLTTAVGAYSELVTERGADLLPMDPDSLVSTLVESINFYRNNPATFSARTREIQVHAQVYDWQYVLNTWEGALFGLIS